MATFKLLLAIDVGDQAVWCLSAETRSPSSPPPMSSELLDRVKSGHIRKPDVRELASDVAHFEDNSAEQIDVDHLRYRLPDHVSVLRSRLFEINNNQLPPLTITSLRPIIPTCTSSVSFSRWRYHAAG